MTKAPNVQQKVMQPERFGQQLLLKSHCLL